MFCEFPTKKKLESIPFRFAAESQAVSQHPVQLLCLQRLCDLAPAKSLDLLAQASHWSRSSHSVFQFFQFSGLTEL